MLGVACNALVEGPDAFSLRSTAPGCDGPCAGEDAGPEPLAPDAEAGVGVLGPDRRAPWPMLGANAAHSGRVTIKASTMSGKISHWKVLPGVPPSAGPAVDGDGVAYFTTTTGTLVAVALDGTIRWTRALGGPSRCTPALGNGAIYATASTGLTAFSPAGDKLWSVAAGAASSPVIAADGTVYVTDVAGVHALSPAGAVTWTYASPGGTALRGDAVAIGDDGVIYAVRNGLHAISPSGVRLWLAPQGDVMAPPPVVAGGKIYIGSGNSLVALRADTHQVAWSSPLTTPALRASPAVDKNGLLYFFDGKILEWISGEDGVLNLPTNDLGVTRPFQPMVDGRGNVYVAEQDMDGVIVTTRRGTSPTSESWSLGLGDDVQPIGFAIGNDGTVFLSAASPSNTARGFVIAIAP